MMIALTLFANFMVMMFGGLEALRAYTYKLAYAAGDQSSKYHRALTPGFRWVNALIMPIGVGYVAVHLLICTVCLLILLCQWITQKSNDIAERMSNL